MERQKQYRKQIILSSLELAGGLPCFILMLISYINSRTTLVLMDTIDSGGNVLRNAIVFFISIFLIKDQRYSYNYGIGKIEASSTLVCDFIMVVSLLVSMGMAVGDLIVPHAPGNFLLFVIVLKILQILGDIFMTWREWRLMKKSDSLVFKTKVAAGIKNTLFDVVTLVAIVLMHIFRNARWTWYISPVVSLLLGGYLIWQTIGRIRQSAKIILDKTADEHDQMLIMQSLSSFYDDFEQFREVRSRYDGSGLFVEFDLGFGKDTTYEQMQDFSVRLSSELKKKIPKCDVSLIIPAGKKISEVEEQ